MRSKRFHKMAQGLTIALTLILGGCGQASENTANSVNAAQAAGGQAEIPETADAAADYARLFMPTRQVTEQGVTLFRQTFDSGFASNPTNVTLEQEHPGTQQAAREAGAAAMQRVFEREIPGIQGRIADAVRPRASAEDLREIGRFMRTETAQAMQRGASQSIAAPAQARAGDGGPALRPEDLANAGAASVNALTPAQSAELLRFSQTPAGRALNNIGPIASGIVMRETNALAERAAPEVNAAIVKVVQERTGTQ